MDFCPIPFNDEARTHALWKVPGLRETDHPALDAICEAVRLLFDCPAAMVTAISEETQWLLSATGIERFECSRRVSLCSYTIMSNEMLVVPDLTRDPRFAAHSKVADGGSELRFYAGVPLVLSSGFRFGSLCTFDTRAHDAPSETQLQVLKTLGDAVVAAIEAPPQATVENGEEDLREANFAILVGHELRTPMTVILGGLGLLEKGTEGSPSNALASRALKASRHLAELIETIMKFSLASTGDLVANERPCRLGEIVAEVIEIVSISPEAQAKSIAFEDRLGANDVSIDRDHIRACMTALILNAILHGGDEITVSARLDDERCIRIDVADNGSLDDSIKLSELYRPFVVGGDLAHHGSRGGIGLGLPLTRKLIELHGGKFLVETTLGKTVASVLLPGWRLAG